MRLGISLNSRALGDDPREGPRSVLGRARAASRAGLDLLCLGDHHSMGSAPYVQNVPMLGRILAEWDERPAGCLFLLPLWHPVLLAEQVGTLAAMAEGPFIVQIGAGGGREAFGAMGARLGDRRAAMEEGIRVVQALFRGETVDSERWGIEGASIAPRPPLGVEWWIGGGVDATVDRAARLGDCWYANADLTLATATDLLERYREACARHGRVPVRLPIRKDVFIAESRREAEEVGDRLVAAGYRGFERAAVAYGDPDSVAEQLAPFAEAGFTDVLIRTMTVPHDAAVRSIELAGEVRAKLATL